MPVTTMTLNGRILEAITVDFWGTIAHDNTLQKRREKRAEYMLEWLNSLGHRATLDELIAVLHEYQDLWHEDWKQRRMTHGAFHIVRYLADKFGMDTSEEQIATLATRLDKTLMEIQPVMMEGADRVLRSFADRGIKLAIISDTAISGPESLDWLLREWSLLDIFPVRVYSEITGVAKPHPKAFLTASQELGVPQHRLLHIGDLESTDILGAKSIGIAALRFDGMKPETECKTCSMADKVVNSWAEISALLLEPKQESGSPFLKIETSAS
jgi:putative hydrolase of the HAD superfamily